MSPVISGVYVKEVDYTVPDDIAEKLVQKDSYALQKFPVSYLNKAIRDPNVMKDLITFALNIHAFRKGMTKCKVLLPLSLYEKVVKAAVEALQNAPPEKRLTLSKLLLAALFLSAKEAGLLTDEDIEPYTQDSAMHNTKHIFFVPLGFKKELTTKIRNAGSIPAEYIKEAIYRFLSDPSFKQNVISLLKALRLRKIPAKCGEKLPLYMAPQEYKKYKELLEQEALFEKYGVSRPTTVILLLHMYDNDLLTRQEFFSYLARLTTTANCQPQSGNGQALSDSSSHQQSQPNNHHTSP
ncbi:hypothetical protein [Sulfolobus tengchongensis spindle-shaped virus 4]|nr:hypothetical protein [Sulfolobus tengchongensis spindle-shaped virus 4]